jgi:ketopantoate reductase
VKRGQAHGVLTPVNERVVELVHVMENGERRPQPEVFQELCSLLS